MSGYNHPEWVGMLRFRHLALVDIFLHGIHLSSYIIEMFIHQFYNMEMVEYMHCFGAVLKDRSDEGR